MTKRQRLETHVIGYVGGNPILAIAGGAPTDLEKLLAIVNGIDADKREKEEPAPTDAELEEARAGLVEALRQAAQGDNPELDAARAIRKAIDAIDAETVTRTEAREAARTEAAELLKGVDATEDQGEGEGSGDGGEGEGSGEGEGEGAPAAPEEKVTVAASAKEIDLAEAIKRGNKRAEDNKPAPKPTSSVMVASVGVAQGHSLDPNATLEDAAGLFATYAGQVKRGSSVLIHMDKLYPESRSLGNSAEENTRMIDAVTAPRAITAAGGICEPLEADFSHPICGDRGRPITDSLPSFRANRGGARFAPSATVADLESAITVWTEANDAADSPEPATKACPRVECEEELSATVDAIVACLTVGNFQARFNPEFWRSRLDLLMVAHDRIAEQTHYATMVAASTTTLVPVGSGDGTVTDVLRVVDMQVAGLRNRHRLINTRFRTVLPAALRNAIRTQLANQAPAGSADLFDIGDARLNAFFEARGVTPVWSPDIELIGAQAGGAALTAYNTPFNVLTYPEGTFVFFDGGTLDLGTNISDSTLNATNDRQAFLETFEQVVFRGCESLVTPVAVAADCICA